MKKYSYPGTQKFSKSFQKVGANYIMSIIIDGYKFVIETSNANNILLEKISSGGNVIEAIKKFITFLHKNKVQYVTVYDIKKRDRYKNILLYIYKKANDDERRLYDKATFIHDRDVIRCKIY